MSSGSHHPALPYRPAPAGTSGGITRLYRDFLQAPQTVAAYFGPAFDDEAALATLAARLQDRQYPREVLACALQELATEVAAPHAATAQLDMLRRPDSLVVFAGQQPGLFTGPLYAIYKALAAERWAADLSSLLDVPVIPCYWLASDDHDFAEVDHIHVPCGAQLSTLRYTPAAAPCGESVGSIVLDRGIEAVIASLADCLPSSGFKQNVLDAIAECYAPGIRFSSAFARLWYRMFPRSRLLFVSPDRAGLPQAAAPLLQQALTDDARLFALYEQTSATLADAGYHRQVHKTATQTFLFHQRGQRHGVRHDGTGHFVWEHGQPVTADWLRRAIDERPGDFSPNVLLRPVVQNALFPTLGVVLGPAETAYYAQIGGLHDHFGVPRPAILPRTSITLVERHMARRLSGDGIELQALRKTPDLETIRVLRARFPPHLDLKLRAAAQKIAAAFEDVGTDIGQFDATLVKAVHAAAVRAGREMDRVTNKVRAAHRRREQEMEAQIRLLSLHLFPLRQPQERVLNIVYYWARYGPRFLDELYQHWPAGRREPLVWEPGSS